jgi:hypothetical protein
MSPNQSSFHHEFLAIDEGLGHLLHVDESNPSRNWIVPIPHPQARDMQLIGDGRVLIGHHHGWCEYDIAGGTLLDDFADYEGVTAVRRQADGSTLVAGVDVAGSSGVVVLRLDAGRREIGRTVYAGDYVRLIRQTEQGTYLMSCNDRIREASPDGEFLRDHVVDGFYHAWKALRLSNGHLIVSAGYGAFMVELDAAGSIVRKFGGREQVPAAVNPFFYAMFQLLANGHIVLANWQGHGPGFGGSGVQLLEFDTAGAIVWSWSDPTRISSLQGLLVLDGLDTALLHDERSGLMKPL